MTGFLIKCFIKNYEDTENAKVRESYGVFSGVVGIVTNVILACAKVFIGMLFSSIAIVADGINNLSDAGSSIMTFVGFKLAGRPEDSGHPYGHARYEYITGLLISIVILLLGLQLFKDSIEEILSPEPVQFSYIMLAILIISIMVKFWQMFFYKKIGEIIHSTTIKAVAKDSRNDVIATSGVLISLLIGKWTGLQIDGWMGALVALFIAYSGISMVRETVDPLLGKAPDREFVDEMKARILGYEGVLGVHDLVVHEYGPKKVFASCHVEVDSEEDVMKSHDLIDNIERDIAQHFQIHFVIHMDPVATKDEKTLQLKEAVGKKLHEIDPIIQYHDFRFVPGYTHSSLIFDVVVPMGYKMKETELITKIQEKVREIDPSYYTVITVDQDYLQEM